MCWLSERSLRAHLLLLVRLVSLPALGWIIYSGLERRSSAAEEAQRDALTEARGAVSQEQLLVAETRQFLALLSDLP